MIKKQISAASPLLSPHVIWGHSSLNILIKLPGAPYCIAWDTYYVPGTLPSLLHILFHLILTKTECDKHWMCSSNDRRKLRHKGLISCRRSQSCKYRAMTNPGGSCSPVCRLFCSPILKSRRGDVLRDYPRATGAGTVKENKQTLAGWMEVRQRVQITGVSSFREPKEGGQNE